MNNKQDNPFARIRRDEILEIIQQNGSVTVNELCDHFRMSPATIRNDLHALKTSGRVERVHGGAINTSNVMYEPDAQQKEVQNVKQKKAIAQAALTYIQPGDVIALDSGTTTFELAKLLVDIIGLTVVTYDLQIATWLERNSSVSVIIAGGLIRKNFHCTAGQTVIDMLSKLHVDKTFSGANGVSIKNGLSTPSIDMAVIKTTLINCADEVFLLCDSSKLNYTSFINFGQLKQVNVLITDSDADPETVAGIEKLGVTVVTKG